MCPRLEYSFAGTVLDLSATGGLDEQRSDLAMYEELRQEDDDSSASEDDAGLDDTAEDVFPDRPLPGPCAHANRLTNGRSQHQMQTGLSCGVLLISVRPFLLLAW